MKLALAAFILALSACSTVELTPEEKACYNTCQEFDFDMTGTVDENGNCRCRRTFQPKERPL